MNIGDNIHISDVFVNLHGLTSITYFAADPSGGTCTDGKIPIPPDLPGSVLDRDTPAISALSSSCTYTRIGIQHAIPMAKPRILMSEQPACRAGFAGRSQDNSVSFRAPSTQGHSHFSLSDCDSGVQDLSQNRNPKVGEDYGPTHCTLMIQWGYASGHFSRYVYLDRSTRQEIDYSFPLQIIHRISSMPGM